MRSSRALIDYLRGPGEERRAKGSVTVGDSEEVMILEAAAAEPNRIRTRSGFSGLDILDTDPIAYWMQVWNLNTPNPIVQ